MRGNVKTFRKRRDLLKLWKKNDELRYSEVRRRALKEFPALKKVSERTFIRYLNELLIQGFLSKRVGSQRRTYYRLDISELRRERTRSLLDSLKIDVSLDHHSAFPLSFLLAKKFPRLGVLEFYKCFEVLGPDPTCEYKVFLETGKPSDFDEKNMEIMEYMMKLRSTMMLQQITTSLIANIVSFVYGKDPRFIETVDELVDWYKDALNQKIVLSVAFDGKSMVEHIKWDEVKSKAKKAGEDWQQKILNATEEGLRKGEEFWKHHPEEAEELRRQFSSRLPELNTKMCINAAIMKINDDYRSQQEAFDAVLTVLSDKKFINEIRLRNPFGLIGLPKGKKTLMKAIQKYLTDPQSLYTLKHRVYQYPGTQRKYDMYWWAVRKIQYAQT